MHLPEWASPSWPQTFDSVLTLFVLTIYGIFKLDRGRILHRRARYFDRLGVSIIAFDYVFGVAFLIAVLIGLYPGLNWVVTVRAFGETVTTNATSDALDAVILSVMFWHWYEVRRADRHRIERAVSPPSVSAPEPTDQVIGYQLAGTPVPPERSDA